MKHFVLFALTSLFTSISFAAPLFFDFQDPAQARQLANENGITLAPYISPSCQQCGNSNYVLAGDQPNTTVRFPNPIVSFYKPARKVTLSVGEWYSPESWAIAQAGNLSVTYRTTSGVVQTAIYSYPITPIFLTFDAGPGAYLTSIATTMTGGSPYVPYIDNMTVYRDGDEEKVKLTIAKLRIAQTVFEPSASDGATTDLVTNKPFVVETTLTANIPNKYSNLQAQASLYIDGNLHSSSDVFRVGDIQNGQSKAFIFGSVTTAGSRSFEVRINQFGDWQEAIDENSLPKVFRTVNFHNTSLSILITEITGCVSTVSTCFSPPTAAQRELVDSRQIAVAHETLPISGNGFTISNAEDIKDSQPGLGVKGDSIYRDAMTVWLRKKLAFKNVGVALVGEDYFLKHRLDTIDQRFAGYTFEKQPGVVFITGARYSTLAHEIVHSLAYNTPHSSDILTEGVGMNQQEVWTTGHSLSTNITLGNLAYDIFTPGPKPNEPAFSINSSVYNSVFKTLVAGDIDPKVVLVTGVINASNQAVFLEIQKGEAFLDPQLNDFDLTVEGLDRNGNVVSSAHSRGNNQIELILESGATFSLPTENTFFSATLPDDGMIASIRLKKGSTILFTEAVEKINLEKVVEGLTTDCFKLKAPLSKVAMQLIDIEYKKYLKFRQKNPKVATVALKLMRATVIESVKANFKLTSGEQLTITNFLKLIDEEIELLK